MIKIPCLFQRDHRDLNTLVYNKVTPGCEWVEEGEGWPTIKFDGTSCLIDNETLYKRYDCKVTKEAKRRGPPYVISDYKVPPNNFKPCNLKPDPITGHWPGWIIVGNEPESKWHREARINGLPSGTYELVGPKIQNNPYNLNQHLLWAHGMKISEDFTIIERSFEGIREFLTDFLQEGIVFWHSDGRMVKIRRSDYGLEWPIRRNENEN